MQRIKEFFTRPPIVQLPSPLKCDADGCDYVSEEKYDWTDEDVCWDLYLDAACPKCDAQLLSTDDYYAIIELQKVIRIVNRIFWPVAWIFRIFTKEKRMKVNMDGSGKLDFEEPVDAD